MQLYSIVLLRCVPDFKSARLSKSQGVLVEESRRILDSQDEYAIELSVKAKEKFGLYTTALMFARSEDNESIRKSLAMGIDKAYFLEYKSENYDDLDNYQRAFLISLCIKEISKLNSGKKIVAILGGDASVVYQQEQIPQRICEELTELNNNRPFVLVNSITDIKSVNEKNLTLITTTQKEVECETPAFLIVKSESNTPRKPSAIDIMRSAKKEVTVLDLNVLLKENPFPQQKIRIVQSIVRG